MGPKPEEFHHTSHLNMCGVHTILCSDLTAVLLCVLTVRDVLDASDVSDTEIICSHTHHYHYFCFPNVHLTHIITLVTSGCIRNYQKMVSSGEFSSTQPWRLCTPPLRVSPTLRRVIWRRVGLGVTPWTQQNPLHMLRLGSDNYVIDVRLHLHHFLSVIVSAQFAHHDSTFLCHMIVSRSKVKVKSARTLGSTVMVGGKNTYRYILHYKWTVPWEFHQTALHITKCHSGLSRARILWASFVSNKWGYRCVNWFCISLWVSTAASMIISHELLSDALH